LTTPRLTTINQDVQGKGKIAAKSLISVIEGNILETYNIVLPVSLIERQSIKREKKINFLKNKVFEIKDNIFFYLCKNILTFFLLQ